MGLAELAYEIRMPAIEQGLFRHGDPAAHHHDEGVRTTSVEIFESRLSSWGGPALT